MVPGMPCPCDIPAQGSGCHNCYHEVIDAAVPAVLSIPDFSIKPAYRPGVRHVEAAMNKTPHSTASTPRPALKGLILMTGIALVLFGGYAVSHWLSSRDDVTWYPPDQACNLHRQSCSARLGDRGRVALKVDTGGRIEAREPLPLEVDVKDLDAREATVDFIGRDMDMGRHRFTLEAGTSGHFSGQGHVNACTREVMPWRARVILNTPDGRIGSWFDFDVARS